MLELLKERESANLKRQLNYIKQSINLYKNKPASKSVGFFTNRIPNITGVTGVYFIIHSEKTFWYERDFYNNDKYKDDARVMYIGQGIVGKRRNVHKRIFNNEGKPIAYYDSNGNVTSQYDSVVGRKMYNYDSDRKNWFFKYIECPKDWAPCLEEFYSWEYNPTFNDDGMVGVG